MPGSFRTGQKDKAIGRATKRLVKNLDLQKHRLRDGKDFMTWAASQLHQVELSDPDARDRLEESLRQALRRERFDWRQWLLPGIFVIVALAVLGATIVVSQLQIRQIRTDLEQLQTPQIHTDLEEIQNSLSELIRDEVHNAQSEYKGIPTQIAALSNRVGDLEKRPVPPGHTPRPTVMPTVIPDEVAKSPTPTPQPIQVTGHVYKDGAQEGIGQVSVELKIRQGEGWSESVDQATTAEDGAFTLIYTLPDPLPTPLTLQLTIRSAVWNILTDVKGDRWSATGSEVKGTFEDVTEISEVTVSLAIRRSFSGRVELLDEEVSLAQVKVLLFRKQISEDQWGTAVGEQQPNNDGTFALLEEPGVHPDAWYQVLIEVPEGFTCTADEKSLFQPGDWKLADLMPEEERSCGLETTGPVTGLTFDGAVFNVQEAEPELPPVQVTDGKILAGGRWGTETGPGGRFGAGPIMTGDTLVKVLGHTRVDDWRLAHEPAADVFFWAGWYTTDEHLVNVDDPAALPLIFQPQGQGFTSDTPEERTPSGWSHEIVDGLEVYHAHSTVTEPVTWKLEGLEPGQWRLQAWVPKGLGLALVSYEVFGQTKDGGGPLTPIAGSPEIDQSKVDTSQFMDIGVYEVREDVTAVEVRLDASKARRGEKAPDEEGCTIGVGAIRAVRRQE